MLVRTDILETELLVKVSISRVSFTAMNADTGLKDLTFTANVFLDFLSDINECILAIDSCHSKAHCTNRNGSFVCTCDGGYSGNGTLCQGTVTSVSESLVCLLELCKIAD